MILYVVIDLEMCSVDKDKQEKYQYGTEIIEIGAVSLDENLTITDSYKTYVHPQYGEIDSYVEKLTRITPEQTENAPPFESAIEDFLQWVPDGAQMVAWSEADKHQLLKESALKKSRFPKLTQLAENSIDCQATFSEKLKTNKVYRLSEALVIADIPYDEGAHDALVDARNTALLFNKMEKEENFSVSKYITAEEDKGITYNPFADLLSMLTDEE